MTPKQFVVLRGILAAGDSVSDTGTRSGVVGVDLGSGALQRLADDLFRREIHAEQ